jgi:hypothetical protein
MTSEIALRLVNTSVEDMKASIECAEAHDQSYSIYCLSLALAIVTKRNEMTKAKILLGKIDKYEKDLLRSRARALPI